MNLIPNEQAIQYGPEILAYWSRLDGLSIKDRIHYKKWFQRDGLMPNLLTMVPVVGRKESQFNLTETGGGELAAEKTLARIRQRFWWPTMRTDVDRKANWCLSRANRVQKKCRSERRVRPHLIRESDSLRWEWISWDQ